MRRTILIDGMLVRGNHVTRGMQCMIVGAYTNGCHPCSIAVWLHHWTGWTIRESDFVVDSVIACCVDRPKNR